MPLVVVRDHPDRPGTVELLDATDDGTVTGRTPVPLPDLTAEVARREATTGPRWVWDDTARRYPPLLSAGVRVARCHDLRLCHAILRSSAATAGADLATAPPGRWDAPRPGVPRTDDDAPTLFDALPQAGPLAPTGDGPNEPDELRRQLDAVAGAREPGRLRLLLAAESTGALVAAEMHHDGLPWDTSVHDALLTGLVGPRPLGGDARPPLLEALADEVRTALGRPRLNPDSQPELLSALRSAGLDVTSTRTHEIRALDHPAVAPLLEYKKRSRLLSANGWHWMESWVRDGRYRPDYVPGGVVTGRWASSGGGALQLPAAVRAAVRADPGWTFVVADAAQLEPRVLAAMSADAAMAAAGRAADLYQGVVDAGIVETRTQAKYAMLGAIYGATTGAAGALMPELTRAYPRAVGLVEDAARAGERGEVVSTWLGRSSPVPGERWWADVRRASEQEARPEDVRTAQRRRREWGRFTRNFVVQGTAAEWALCWMASVRRRIAPMPGRPHLAFFLHDEVLVHTPRELADDVAAAVRDAAAEAGRLLFGAAPVDFALDVSVVDSYDQAV
ncbi:bifunctional 3'-5' exonuclease/DNA polymerase [Cellulomonas carbonis]|uniref:DNA-directed DNA polymerase n=1 Tax=Cellulomonas carbonis T26 TaxID=947969 RepID=A0A0A0BUA4_9CELL|nr:bifunctional 3'-5' exonuclease/DNA polymerase [Cellulomonas carbonis]KGM11516.1 3'-5' exonuclease [Cellulomonas carbonis T26]GGC02707.1 bifunctional 3'-5' exonuclease/DNA polymerase [Cellulomonas carbonis]